MAKMISLALVVCLTLSPWHALGSPRLPAGHSAAPAAGVGPAPVPMTGAAADTSDWRRVVKLREGASILLTVRGEARVRRVFVVADDAGLTAFNFDDPPLPRRVRKMLTEAASRNPKFFAANATTRIEPDLVIDPDGIFLAGLLVAPTQRVVVRVPRDAVVEIGKEKRGSTGTRILGGFLGLFMSLALGVGGLFLGIEAAVWVGLIGSPAGAIMGAVYGASGERVIYRAPRGSGRP